ncbi:MAG: LysE family transporter [Anaerolineae bacterium]|nr:LysE family transporter [Anaerolineae bacterium]
MDLSFLIRGIVIGFSIAAPVGPIGVLCIRRTLATGRISGLATGLGAASADAIYGAVAGFGLTAVSAFLVDQQSWFSLIGGLFLVYLGVRTLLAKTGEDITTENTERTEPEEEGKEGESTNPRSASRLLRVLRALRGDKSGASNGGRAGLAGDYLSTFFLTLTNPVTILSFVAIFAGLGLAQATGESRDYLAAGVLVLGVFLGSALWWLTLSGIISLVRVRFTPRAMLWVNRLSGATIIALGLTALASLVLGAAG